MRILWLGLVVILALCPVNARPVMASTIVVTTTVQSPGGEGDCTLGEAIEAANGDIAVDGCVAGSGDDTIELPAGTYTLMEPAPCVPYIYTCTNGLPAVRTNLTISGAGAEKTIVERDENAPAFRILYTGGSRVLLRGFTVRGGTDTNTGPFVGGGGIGNEGNLALEDMAVGENYGVGIATLGSLEIKASEIKNNNGLGIVISSAHAHPLKSFSLIDSRVTGNTGGGISAVQVVMVVLDSIVSDNVGIGIRMGGASLRMEGSTVSDNSDVGIFAIDGQSVQDQRARIAITNSAIFRNLRRGLRIQNPRGGDIVVENTTLANNGGGIAIIKGRVRLRIHSSTIEENSTGPGGGIFDQSESSNIKLANTILGRNQRTIGADCSGKIISLGYNIFESTEGCEVSLSKGDLVTNPRLGDWQDDGTPGNGHYPLQPDSPAIGKAKRKTCPLTDQLGNSRVGRCDIGAVEYIPAP